MYKNTITHVYIPLSDRQKHKLTLYLTNAFNDFKSSPASYVITENDNVMLCNTDKIIDIIKILDIKYLNIDSKQRYYVLQWTKDNLHIQILNYLDD